MAKYKYFVNEKDRKVIAVSTYAGRTVRGIAKADPRDTFDIESGKILAKARCDEKVARKRKRRAFRKMYEALDILKEAQNYYNRMEAYYNDSVAAHTVAENSLNSLVDSL